MSITLIKKSNGVNLLFLFFTFLSKDCPFCQKLQSKQAKDKTGRGAQTQSVLMPVPRGGCGLTAVEDQGVEATNSIPHNMLNITALAHVPDVWLQDPRGVRADNTLVHGHIFRSHQTIQKPRGLVPKPFPGWQGSLRERNAGYAEIKSLKRWV